MHLSFAQYLAADLPSEQREFIDCIRPEQARTESFYNTLWMSDAQGTPGRLYDMSKAILENPRGTDATCWEPWHPQKQSLYEKANTR